MPARKATTTIKHPEDYFRSWCYNIPKASWSALGVVGVWLIDKKKTEKARKKWEDRTPRYKALAPHYFKKRQAVIKGLPDFKEWSELKSIRSKVSIHYFSYQLKEFISYDFHEGDVFWHKQNHDQYIQISRIYDSIEIAFHDPSLKTTTPYLVTDSELARILESGDTPKPDNKLEKNQVNKEIDRFYVYS